MLLLLFVLVLLLLLLLLVLPVLMWLLRLLHNRSVSAVYADHFSTVKRSQFRRPDPRIPDPLLAATAELYISARPSESQAHSPRSVEVH